MSGLWKQWFVEPRIATAKRTRMFVTQRMVLPRGGMYPAWFFPMVTAASSYKKRWNKRAGEGVTAGPWQAMELHRLNYTRSVLRSSCGIIRHDYPKKSRRSGGIWLTLRVRPAPCASPDRCCAVPCGVLWCAAERSVHSACIEPACTCRNPLELRHANNTLDAEKGGGLGWASHQLETLHAPSSWGT